MTTCFIVLSLLSAYCTYNLYRPFNKNFGLTLMGLAIAVFCGELVLFFLGLQLIGVLVFIYLGAVQGLVATLALALVLVSWFGLINYFITAVRSADSLRKNVDQLLAAEPDQNTRSNGFLSFMPTQFSRGMWQRVRRPFSPHLANVTRTQDVVYTTVNGLELALDIYTPKDIDKDTAAAPVLLYFHGGGLHEKGGSKKMQGLPLLNDFAGNGWIAISINYRLSPTYRWPDHLIDSKTALHWIKENIASYGGNPDFVVTSGDSAGGQLSALMALTANKPEFQPERTEFDSTVQGAICCYGVMDFGNLYNTQIHTESGKFWAEAVLGEGVPADEFEQGLKSSSPMANIHADAAPLLVIHGTHDALIGVGESRLFVEKLSPIAKNPVVYGEISGAHHSFNVLRSPRCELVNLEILRFANGIHEQWQAER